MTNVPDNIRTALADAYKLFDVSYQMTGTDEEWKQYWDKANIMIQKYGDDIPLLFLLDGYAYIIQEAVEKRNTGNAILTWDKDEEYPHPKGDKS